MILEIVAAGGCNGVKLVIGRLEIYGNEVANHISIVSPSFLRCRSASFLQVRTHVCRIYDDAYLLH